MSDNKIAKGTKPDYRVAAKFNRTLIQEELRDGGSEHWKFWMLVACTLMNLTPGKRARPVLAKLRHEFPTPAALACAYLSYVRSIVRGLGFGVRRTNSIVEMAREWRRCLCDDVAPMIITDVTVRRLPGCGRYASDSWAIFVEGRRDVSPTDKELRAYLRRTAVG